MTARLLKTSLALLFLALFEVLEATKISCRNEEGKAVDWKPIGSTVKAGWMRTSLEFQRLGLLQHYRFTFYKLPIQVKRQDKKSKGSGLEYLYLDSTTRSWKRSKQPMNTTKSVLGRTLHQLYEAYTSKSNNTAYLIYNDGVPKSVTYSTKYGHTKVPEEGYDYPPTGRRNGQSGICITFKYNQYEAIDSQLLVCNPNIYSCSIPAIFHQKLIHMSQLCTRSSSSKIPGRHLTRLQSAQGENFLHFAKSNSFLDDIFAAWMAPQLKTHLLTETWQRTGQKLPSNCSLPYHVYNIKAIKLSQQSYFNSSQDHAKWCISQKGTKNHWTCIGDINRSTSQAFRSGGFICTQNQHIYQAFQRLVLYYEKCN
ncbi:deoxyribonuclease-2-beta isoform X1 [Lemur catta]|uniref:deoxyribonuclease-2-beta isoform X1 n=2 Tax=Lemur catta TaxID=9447 RepID=UPI001E26AE00|nr:deoxyribonuclease-2-beta isoform X1 [Lemur catta]